jgi:hypothetical protein
VDFRHKMRPIAFIDPEAFMGTSPMIFLQEDFLTIIGKADWAIARCSGFLAGILAFHLIRRLETRS